MEKIIKKICKSLFTCASVFLLATICLSPVTASAINPGLEKTLKEDGFTGVYYDRDIKSWTIYKNGELAKNCWGYDGDLTFYVGDDFKPVKGWKEIDGNTYYFNPSGNMQRVSRKIDGVYRTFTSDGHLIK